MRAVKTGLTLALAGLLGGCAYFLNAAVPGEFGAGVDIAVQPRPGTMEVVVTAGKPVDRGIRTWVGLAVDALATSNLLLMGLTFRSTSDAVMIVGLGTGALVLGDLALSAFGPRRPETEHSLDVRLTNASVRLMADGGSRRVVGRSLDPQGKTYVARLPLSVDSIDQPLRLEVIDQWDRLMAVQDLQLTASDWLANLALEPAPAATPAPAAVVRRTPSPAWTPAPARTLAPVATAPPLRSALGIQTRIEDPLDENAVHGDIGATLVFRVSNKTAGPVGSVQLRLSLDRPVPGLELAPSVLVGTLEAGQTRTVRTSVIASPALRQGQAYLRVTATTNTGHAAEPSFVTLDLKPAPTVDVDEPLAKAPWPDRDAVAVVIGIERYNSRIPEVPFAERDARAVREHFETLFRVPPENVIFLANESATQGAIRTALEGQLPALVKKGRSKVYIFFAGHGAPDLESRSAFLVPHDGNPAFPRTSCYLLGDMYRALAKVGAERVTVFLDACFTGVAGRSEKAVSLLAQARPLLVVPLQPEVPPGISVQAAAAGDQISLGYPAMKHGLFTYYLLKGLRGVAAPGMRLTQGKLHDYLVRNVSAAARRQGHEQTPVYLGGRPETVLLDP